MNGTGTTESPIFNALNEIHAALGKQHDMVTSLKERLVGVMSPEEPKSEMGPEGAPDGGVSSLELRMRDTLDHVHANNAVLQDLLTRLRV